MSNRSVLVLAALPLVSLVAFSSEARAQARCPYGIDGTLSDATATEQVARLKNGGASTCLAPKAAPSSIVTTQKFKYDAHTLKNRSSATKCVTVAVTAASGGAESVAYLDAYDPTNQQASYLGDAGGNASPGTPTSYSFNVPALANFVVVVNSTTANGTTAYHLDVTDCGAVVVTSVTPNAGPTAGGTAVTVKGSGFLANAAVTLDGVAATDIVLVDEATLTAKTPAHAEGLVDLAVTNADTTTSTLTGAFTFVSPTGTSILLASATNPSVFGQSVTFSATLTSGAGKPAGSVKFFDGATMIGSGTLDAAALATFATTGLEVGTHAIHAEYAGDATFAAATSSTTNQAVNKAGSVLVLGSSKGSAAVGDALVFTATATAKAPGAGTPTGDVTFTVDGVQLSTAPLGGAGATASSATLTAGDHTIEAAYAGDAHFLASSTSFVQHVGDASDGGASSSSSSSGASSSSGNGVSSSGVDGGAPSASGDSDDSGGCGCHQTSTRDGGSVLLGLLGLGLLVSRRRRTR